jgi:hypothetical protein
MNIIYKNTDFTLPVHVVDSDGIIPIEDLEVLNIKVFTTDISTCITFDKTDLDASGNLHIDASTMADCENGLIYFKYQGAYPDTAWEDGVYDVAKVVQTDNYFKYHDNAPAHKTTCATAVSELVNDIHYATQDWVTEQIENAAEAGVDLTNYYTKSQIDEKFDDIDVSVDLTNYYTKSEVDQKIADISAGDVSIHVDLSDYYTKSEVDELIPDTSGFITVSALSDYATKADLSTAIADVSVDLSNYYNKSEIDTKLDEIVIGDASVDLSNYYTKSQVDQKISNDTSLFITRADLSTAIDGIDVSVDLTNYYTKSEVDELIPDTSGFLTGNDISTFITISALSDYATKTDLSTFVTATDLSTAIAGVDTSVDLSDYYTKSEVDQIVEDLVIGDVSINLSDYATKQEVEDNEEVISAAISDLYQKTAAIEDMSTMINDQAADIYDIRSTMISGSGTISTFWVGDASTFYNLGTYDPMTMYLVKE